MKIQVWDTKIHYIVKGKGEPAIFIHGARSDAQRWIGIVDIVAQKYKVYAPDLPGYGKSEELEEYHSIERFADYMLEFLRQLNLERVCLVGGSLGGMIGLHMLKKDPACFSKIALLGTPVHPSFVSKTLGPGIPKGIIFWAIGQIAKRKSWQIFMRRVLKTRWLMEWIYKRFGQPDTRDPKHIEKEIKNWFLSSIRVWAETMADVSRFDFLNKVKSDMPTLIVDSDENQYFDYQGNTKALQKMFPNNKVIIIKGMGHSPTDAKGEDFVKKMKPYWEKAF